MDGREWPDFCPQEAPEWEEKVPNQEASLSLSGISPKPGTPAKEEGAFCFPRRSQARSGAALGTAPLPRVGGGFQALSEGGKAGLMAPAPRQNSAALLGAVREPLCQASTSGSPRPAKKDRSGSAPPLFSCCGGGSPGRRKRLAPKSRLLLSRQPRQPHPCRPVSSASPTLCSGTGEPGKGKPAQLPKSHPFFFFLSRPLGELTLCVLWADNILTGRTRSLPGATPAFSRHAVVKMPKAPPS